jgi:(p)ppGpp synthase/HD superfamily hydrolase
MDARIAAQLAALPLKEMDSALLTVTLLAETSAAIPGSVNVIRDAAATAAWVHRKHTRANRAGLPRTPYIEHPLRLAVRLLRWGVRDTDVIVAALFHDTVEDNPYDLARLADAPEGLTEADARTYALRYLEEQYGPIVARTVAAVTNPLPSGNRRDRATRNGEYFTHVAHAIADPRAYLVKVDDVFDNALSLHHTAEGLGPVGTARRAQKYLPLLDLLAARIGDDDIDGLLPLAGQVQISAGLAAGRVRLVELAGGAPTA